MTKFKNKRILLVSKNLYNNTAGGREQLSRTNINILKDIYEKNLHLYDTYPKKLQSLNEKFNGLIGYLDGLDKRTCQEILKLIIDRKIQSIFIDGSNFGKLAYFLKKSCPEIEIISFFHNVESKFFYDAFRKSKSLKAFFILLGNFYAERLAVRYSDKIISLSKRDSEMLYKLYGKKATHISPLIIQKPKSQLSQKNIPNESFLIFVGGAFYANIHGIKWFINNVMPSLDENLYVIGKGFENYKEEFEQTKNVQVLGFVESLADWYNGAKYIVAPIFEGSGMKTKVAESLMFGKVIIGSPEAFSGYEDVIDIAGTICTSKEDYINAIKYGTFDATEKDRFEAYDELYSVEAGKMRLKKILN
jgi:hypothetical protein